MKPDETLPGNLESLKEHSGKIRFGASDGPRRKRKGKYDGSSPLFTSVTKQSRSISLYQNL